MLVRWKIQYRGELRKQGWKAVVQIAREDCHCSRRITLLRADFASEVHYVASVTDIDEESRRVL
jgi:hypothetical protein